MIKLDEFLMGREKEYPLTLELALNAARTLASINYIRGRYGKPMITSSGYRPGKYNTRAGGAKNSNHQFCLAEDVKDVAKHKITKDDPVYGKYCINEQPFMTGDFALWCLDNLSELEKAGLYMEHPAYTPGWVHLQSDAPASGNRIFIPYSGPPPKLKE